MLDVIVVGGGPAGLSAALVLGRCRRQVLLCDSGKPRNWAARAMHGFISRDGIDPAEFRRIARAELKHYPNVTLRDIEVSDAKRDGNHFDVQLSLGEKIEARVLLLATGKIDVLPEIEGAREFYGRGVYHCPYCDGWEHRDEPLAVYGNDGCAIELASELRCWSAQVVLCTDGPAKATPAQRAGLKKQGVRIIEQKIVNLAGGDQDRLKGIHFVDGSKLPITALFFYPHQFQHSDLPEKLGCCFTGAGAVHCEGAAAVNAPGVYVAGNMRSELQLVIMAAAEGTEAAFAINTALHEQDWGEIDGKA
ncbi:MAG: NAD(P)/FAD-dependent oxidoreductase [Verrucomicrobiales bacterium]